MQQARSELEGAVELEGAMDRFVQLSHVCVDMASEELPQNWDCHSEPMNLASGSEIQGLAAFSVPFVIDHAVIDLDHLEEGVDDSMPSMG